jgi:hypothetical protein
LILYLPLTSRDQHQQQPLKKKNIIITPTENSKKEQKYHSKDIKHKTEVKDCKKASSLLYTIEENIQNIPNTNPETILDLLYHRHPKINKGL